MNVPPNLRDLLDRHVTLELASPDRLYLNGYVPKLQCGAGLVQFLSQHRGHPIASPALPGQITGQFVAQVPEFAQAQDIPLFPFRHKESKDQRAHQLRRQRAVADAVVFIGVAQEKAYAFSAALSGVEERGRAPGLGRRPARAPSPPRSRRGPG